MDMTTGGTGAFRATMLVYFMGEAGHKQVVEDALSKVQGLAKRINDSEDDSFFDCDMNWMAWAAGICEQMQIKSNSVTKALDLD